MKPPPFTCVRLFLIFFSLTVAGCNSSEKTSEAATNSDTGVRYQSVVDTTFAINGIQKVGFAETAQLVEGRDITVANDDSIYIAGTIDLISQRISAGVLKLTPDGSIDTTFGDNGLFIANVADTNSQGNSITTLSDGSVIFTGVASAYATTWKITPNGEIDTAFGVRGLYTNTTTNSSFIKAITQNDDKIVLLAEYNPANCMIVRLLSNGEPDNSFGSNGASTIDTSKPTYCKSITILSDGRIVVIGNINYTSTDTRLLISTVLANGEPDLSFGNNGQIEVAFSDYAQLYTAKEDLAGNIIAGGYIHKDNLRLDLLMLKISPSGVLYNDFGTSGVVRYIHGESTFARDIAFDSDGRIIAIGPIAETSIFEKRLGVFRFSDNGQLDPTFGENGVKIADNLGWVDSRSIATQSGYRHLIGGHTGNNEIFVTRLSQD